MRNYSRESRSRNKRAGNIKLFISLVCNNLFTCCRFFSSLARKKLNSNPAQSRISHYLVLNRQRGITQQYISQPKREKPRISSKSRNIPPRDTANVVRECSWELCIAECDGSDLELCTYRARKDTSRWREEVERSSSLPSGKYAAERSAFTRCREARAFPPSSALLLAQLVSRTRNHYTGVHMYVRDKKRNCFFFYN